MLDTLIIYGNYQVKFNYGGEIKDCKIVIDTEMRNINKLYLECNKKYCYYLFLDSRIEKVVEINCLDEIIEIIKTQKPAIIELTKKNKIYHRSVIHYIYPYVEKYIPVMYKLIEIIEEPLAEFKIKIGGKINVINSTGFGEKNKELIKLWSELHRWFEKCIIKKKKIGIYNLEIVKKKILEYEIWEINFLNTFDIFQYFDVSHIYFKSKIIEFHKNNREIHGQCGPYHFRHDFKNINRNSIINHLICKFNYQTYLEIGVNNCYHFADVNIENKTGVEPEPDLENGEYKKWKDNIYVMLSAKFFEKMDSNIKFDIVFIDGCLVEDNIMNDVKNSLEHLSANGIVVVHDCNPPSRFLQRDNYYERYKGKSIIWNNKKYTDRHWNGKAWKMIVTLRETRKDLSVEVVDTDWGIGLIKFGNQDLLKLDGENLYDYNTLIKYRKKMLNLISAEEFLLRYQ